MVTPTKHTERPAVLARSCPRSLISPRGLDIHTPSQTHVQIYTHLHTLIETRVHRKKHIYNLVSSIEGINSLTHMVLKLSSHTLEEKAAKSCESAQKGMQGADVCTHSHSHMHTRMVLQCYCCDK